MCQSSVTLILRYVFYPKKTWMLEPRFSVWVHLRSAVVVGSLESEVLGTGSGCNTDSPPPGLYRALCPPGCRTCHTRLCPNSRKAPRVWHGQVGQVQGTATLCRLQARIQPITGSNEIQGADGRPSLSIRTRALRFRCEALLE